LIELDGLIGGMVVLVSAGFIVEVSVPIGTCPFTPGFAWVDGF
jgi:hypothetical protein